MELLLHQWGDWPELYRNTDKTEATEIVIIDSQMNDRGKLDTYPLAHDRHDLLFTCSIMGRMWIAADPISAFRRASESGRPIAVTKEIFYGCDMARPFRHF